jgi:hypothetical protein
MTKIFNTWCERIDAPEMSKSHIRQFKDAIALPALAGVDPSGAKTSLLDHERRELWHRFAERVSREGGPLVTEAQADQGREWLHRYAKRIGMPITFNWSAGEHIDYLAIRCFRFVDVEVCGTRVMPFALPTYECDWGDGVARLRYTPAPWQSQMSDRAEWHWCHPREVYA